MSERATATGEWWLYVIETAAGRLYTGITTDVERRFNEHCEGKRGARALRGKGPLTLRFSVPVGDRSMALKREYAFKQLARADKLAVVEGRQWLEKALALDD
ncbi:GIY-YIG nuclease family protein [Carnimonas bestiolae]|uniref:GIY-YIG nuclease family protein n=1 Tax=Carnimonas bestiolae TaxID=3402172 RepID=UPI003EDBCC29